MIFIVPVFLLLQKAVFEIYALFLSEEQISILVKLFYNE
ncbi:hypothetical protein ACUXCP_002103 [Staphylococcus haemolyticus]